MDCRGPRQPLQRVSNLQVPHAYTYNFCVSAHRSVCSYRYICIRRGVGEGEPEERRVQTARSPVPGARQLLAPGQRVAFSQPTDLGQAFAEQYMRRTLFKARACSSRLVAVPNQKIRRADKSLAPLRRYLALVRHQSPSSRITSVWVHGSVHWQDEGPEGGRRGIDLQLSAQL